MLAEDKARGLGGAFLVGEPEIDKLLVKNVTELHFFLLLFASTDA